MQSCYIGGSLQSLQGRAGIHNRPTVLTMPPIHLMQNDVLDLTNLCRRRMKTPCRRAGRTVRHRNCNVKLDDLDWDRPDLDCEFQQAWGIPRNRTRQFAAAVRFAGLVVAVAVAVLVLGLLWVSGCKSGTGAEALA